MDKKVKKELDRETEKLFVAEAKMRATIAARGEQIAKERGYEDLYGMDAVYRYLIDTHHWLPNQVRSLSTDDLRLLLAGYHPGKKTA